ncbi:helix-turn-helix domain-containing protein [Escherichia coli]|nr:helix-turn-helix domain-containing protein [Escherichia coli]
MIATKTPAIDKAARIFHFIAGKGSATYSEIHQNVGLPQSTTSALLASLTTHAFLRQKNGRYYLGLIFYELGNKAIQDFDFRELAEESLVFLRDRTRLACHLGVLDGSTGIYLAKKKARMRLSFAAGRENDFPAQFLPLGKCCWPGFRKTTLMLFYPQNTFLRLLPGQLQHVKR